jgi:hypothetical protein
MVQANMVCVVVWGCGKAGHFATSKKRVCSFGDMSSFVGRFHRGFGSLGDMSSFVGRFNRGFGSLGTESLSADS